MKPKFIMMTEEEFDNAYEQVFNKMYAQYPMMTMGDIQSVAQFFQMFKEHCMI